MDNTIPSILQRKKRLCEHLLHFFNWKKDDGTNDDGRKQALMLMKEHQTQKQKCRGQIVPKAMGS
jgi:hypothetical protein